MSESLPYVMELKDLADKLEAINTRLTSDNAKLRAAIILLADAVDEVLPFVPAINADAIERARIANQAARFAVL